MKQCKLQNENSFVTAWIDSKGAKEGFSMTLDGYDGRWTVIEVYDHEMDEKLLKEHQRNTRNIFGSILT